MAMLGGSCYLCGKKAGSHFHLHHFKYDEVESNYPRDGRSLHVRMKRVAEAGSAPERFRLLCAGCHGGLEKFRSSRLKVDFSRLSELLAAEF